MNKTIFQFFHWYYPSEDNLWKHAATEAEWLASMGITHIWLPPAYKSAKGINEPGYAVYDLYDLGEFDQKGTVRTKYGTKGEYLEAIKALQKANIEVLADIVLNHKMGGDEKEQVQVQKVNADNRKEFKNDPYTTEAFTRFTFPGRQGRYSDFIWDHSSFTGFSENNEILMIINEHTNGKWEEVLENEKGNFDYLMGNDIELRNPQVQEELNRWGCWYIETTGINGFRLDGLKHISPDFFPEWIDFLNDCYKKDFIFIGEYWKSDVKILSDFIQTTQEKISLFDVPLHFNFHEASQKGADYDMRSIFDNTLVKEKPDLAITFVENHDTQPLQALESSVEAWFKPLAYTLILLRKDGFPCVFYPSIYEAKYQDEKEGEQINIELKKVQLLPTILKIRKDIAYGEQRDYFDNPHVIGWTREGTEEMQHSGVAVLLSNTNGGEKIMCMGDKNAGRKLVDISGNHMPDLTLNEKGEGVFRVDNQKIAIYVDENLKTKYE